jgi:hypothetical protein
MGIRLCQNRLTYVADALALYKQAIGAFGGDTSPVPTAEEIGELRMLVGALGDRAPELGTALQTLERLAAQQPLVERSDGIHGGG